MHTRCLAVKSSPSEPGVVFLPQHVGSLVHFPVQLMGRTGKGQRVAHSFSAIALLLVSRLAGNISDTPAVQLGTHKLLKITVSVTAPC